MIFRRLTRSFLLPAAAAIALFALPAIAAELPDPDGKPADMGKPVQVYILLGQSNMLGMGKVGEDIGDWPEITKVVEAIPSP